MSSKARNGALGLIVAGAFFAVIGMISGSGDEHFLTRLMTNGIINGFFFFAIGLGALFFLALNYAVEAGWYVVVKRIIESVALYLPYGIAIFGGVLLVTSILHGAHVYTCAP